LAAAARATVTSRLTVGGGLLLVFGALAMPAVLWAIPVLVAIVLATKLLDGRAWRSALRRGRVMRKRLPEPAQFADDRVRAVVSRLGEVRQAIGQVLDAGPQGTGFDLASSVGHVPQLESDVIVLAHRAEYVAAFLTEHPVSELATLERRHEERMERDGDPIRAGVLGRSDARLKERLDAATALSREYDRLLASAGEALGALETLPVKMMLLQLRRLDACHMPSALADLEREDVQASLKEIEPALADGRGVADPDLPGAARRI
jgi:hypothetical protein